MRVSLAGFIILFSVITGSQASQIASYNIQNWQLGAFSNDQTGEFSHCAGSTPYLSGITMFLSVNNQYGWSMGFFDPSWNLTPNASYNITTSIDGRAQVGLVATAFTNQFAVVQLPNSVPLFNSFRMGYQLRVDAAGQTFFFNLAGTNAVLTSLVQCVASHIQQASAASAGNTNPFTPPIQPAPNASSDSSIRAEATAMAANLLSLSGVSGFYILSPAEVPKGVAADAAWRMGSVFGTLNILQPAVGLQLQGLPSYAIAGDAKSCKGKFASGSLPDESSGSQMVRAFTSCEAPNGAFTAFYVYFPRPSGGFYMIGTAIYSSDELPAKQADTNIRQALYKILQH